MGKKLKIFLISLFVFILVLFPVKVVCTNYIHSYKTSTKQNLLGINLKIKDKQRQGVTLSWEDCVENNEEEISYKVYLNNEYIATTNDNYYTFTNLSNTRKYNLRVEIINKDNQVIKKEEINDVTTAKVISQFSNNQNFPKDVYYIDFKNIFEGQNITFEAGSVLKIKDNLQFSIYGTLNINGDENERTIITSESYDGSYNKDDIEKYSKASIGIYSKSSYELRNVDFLCGLATINVVTEIAGTTSVNNCYFHNMVYFNPTGNLEGINSFCNNTLKNGNISSYAKELLISNNNITNGTLDILSFKNAKCSIKNNKGINDNGAILKLDLSKITSEEYLQDLLVNNKNLSTSNKALDIHFQSFPTSVGTFNLSKGNYLFFKNVTGYISNIDLNCNLTVEAGSNINISKNAYIKTNKSIKFNGTEEDNINIDCYENKMLQDPTSKWGKFHFLDNVNFVASYTNISNSGNWYSNANVEKSAWLTYGAIQSTNNIIKLDNVNVTDNDYGIAFISSNVEITNSNLLHNIYLKDSLDSKLQNNKLKEVKCDVNSTDLINTKNFICTNNIFEDGTNVIYIPIDASTCIIKNNIFNVNKEYLNIDLQNCTTNPNKNILDNISENINNGSNKYNIHLKSIPITNNLYLKKNTYYFDFENIDCDMEIEHGSSIYLTSYKNLNIAKKLKLLGTSDEKIIIDTTNEQYWKGFNIKESGTLEINNAVIRKTGMYISGYNYSWLLNSGKVIAENISFENYIKKPIIVGKNSYTQISNTEIDTISNEGYKKLDIKNCNISNLTLKIPTTIEEINETILENNVINNSAITFTPNMFSTAVIKNNTINKLESPPLILTLENANENILDNILNNVSPDMGIYTNMIINSLPETFTLKKGSYYLLSNLTGNKNIDAGCCIKLAKRRDLTLEGTINFNGTKEEPITITSIEDNGLNNNLEIAQTWKYLYINSNSSITANYVNIKNGGECAYISGNINFDNVIFDEKNTITYIEKGLNDIVTTNIKNSKLNALNVKWNSNRKAQILDNVIKNGTILEYLPVEIDFEYKNNISKGTRNPLYVQNISNEYLYIGESFKNTSGNYNEDDSNYNAIYFLDSIVGYNLSFKGKFPKNEYYMPVLRVNLDSTCEIEKGSKIKVYKRSLINGNLILNGTILEPILYTSEKEGTFENYGTLIINNTDFYNIYSLTNSNNLYMINSNFSKENKNSYLNLLDSKSLYLKNNYLDLSIRAKEYTDLTYNYWGEGIIPPIDLPYIVHPYNETFIKSNEEFGDIIKENKLKNRNLFGVSGVNGHTGNYCISNDDFKFKVDNINLDLSYTYNSLNDDIGLMGKGWNFGAFSKIESIPYYDKRKYVYLPNGSVNIFDKIQNSNEYESLNSRNKLIQNDDTYELVTLNMTRYLYNSNGYLYKIIDKHSNEINLEIDEKGKVKKVKTYGDKEYIISYENNKISKIVDPIGRQAHYLYNDNGMLTQVIGVAGKSTYYAYDEDNLLISIKEENDSNEQIIVNEVSYYKTGENKNKINTLKDSSGKVDTYTYSATTTIKDQNNRTIIENYNQNGYKIAVTEPNNLTSTTTYTNISNKPFYNEILAKKDITGKVTNYKYDTNGNIIKETIAGKSKSYLYNDKNCIINKTDENLNEIIYEYANDNVTLLKEIYLDGGTINYEYNESDNIKGKPSKIIDKNGNATTYTYDDCGNKISETDANDNTTTYTYNNIGWLLSKTTPKNEVISYEYDNYGNVIKITEDEKNTSYEYNYKSSKIKEIDRNSNVQIYEYDNSQNLVKHIDKEGIVTSYEYDIYNNKIKEIKPNDAIYTYEYDTINRNIGVSINFDNKTSILEEKQYIYSGGSKIITTKKYKDENNYSTYIDRYNANGDIISKELGNKKFKTTYSNTYKKLSEENETGKKTYYTYDNLDNLIKKYEEVDTDLYKITKYEYDKVGNVIKEITSQEKIDLNEEPTTYIVYTYTYDNVNNLIKTISSSGEEIKYTYDQNKNKIKEEIKISDDKYKVTDYTYNYANKVLTKSEFVEQDTIEDLDAFLEGENPQAKLTTTYVYDNENNLLKERLADNSLKTYKYNKNGKEIETSIYKPIMEPEELPLTEKTTYDKSGNIISKTDGNSNITQYVYNKLNQKIQEIKPNNIVTNYSYDLMGNLINEIKPNGSSNIVYTYNLENQNIKKVLNYENEGNLKEIVTEYEYDNCDNLTKETTSNISTAYVYNKIGKLINKTDGNNNSILYEYDAMGNVISKTDAKGTKTNYEYDERNNLTKKDIEGIIQEEKTYDFLNNVTSSKDELKNEIIYAYNSRGDLIHLKETETGYEIKNKYNINSTLANKEDNCGLKIKYEYDILKNVISEISSNKTNNKESITIKSVYDKVGNKIEETDGNGYTTKYVYDANNNLIEKIDAKLNSITYTYDKNGNKLTETDNNGNTKTFVYDGIDRLIKKSDSYGNVIEKLEYDDLGRQIKSTDANENSILYEYDKTDNVIKKVDERQAVEKFEYDKNYNKVKYYDKNNNLTKYEYDNKNNLTKVTNSLNESTTYTYDNIGNIIKVVDAKQNEVKYEYDKRSNEIKKIDQLGSEEIKTYDKNGNMLSFITNNEDKFEYEYDVYGRMIKEKQGEKEVIYSYDNNDNITKIGNETKTYDSLNRVIKINTEENKYITYDYNDTKKEKKIVDIFGNEKLEKYDKENRLQKVIQEDEETEYTYNSNGSLNKITNKINDEKVNETNYEYYENNKLKSLTTKNNNDNIITRSQYEYDLNGNTTKEVTNETEKTYTYDSLNRLKTSSDLTSYTYDKVGNIQTKTQANGKVTAYTYNAKNELTNAVTQKDLQVISQENYTYDKNGNQIEENKIKVNENNENEVEITKYLYNPKNELEEVKINDKLIEEYKYNEQGNRIQKKNEEGITKYVYDRDRVILEIDENNNEKARNTYGISLIKRKANCKELVEENKEITNEIINNLNESDVESETVIQNTEEGPKEKESIKTGYYLYNGHGDVISIVDKESNILNTYEYDNFGQVIQESESLDNIYKYAGYIQDRYTQNYYLNARYYNPAIQRFITEDTVRGNIEDPLSLNLYTYSHNNPLKYVDPSGHSIIAAATTLIGGITLKDILITTGIATTMYTLSKIDYVNLTNDLSGATNVIKSGISNVVDNIAESTLNINQTSDLYDILSTTLETLKTQVNISKTDTEDVINTLDIEIGKVITKRDTSDIYNHTVYILQDKNTKETKYVGRTTNENDRRKAHHRDPIKKGYKFIPKASKLTKEEARMYEQILIFNYGMEKYGGQLVNRRNEIASKNKKVPIYLEIFKDSFVDKDNVISLYNRMENEYFNMLGI